MMKSYLMAPGPSMIPEAVLLEMAKPIIHHRTKEFETVIGEVRAGLKHLFQTKNDVVILSTSGSGGMESAVVNFFSPGDKVLVVVSGKFGERWSAQAKEFGLHVIEFKVPSGDVADISIFEKLLKENDPKGVFSQACETSTGVMHPIAEMGKLISQRAGTIFLVDAITALGISDIRTDTWNLDVVVSGSQKALMLPPGLAMLSVSPKALGFLKNSKIPKYYFNLEKELELQRENTTHFTPAISLIQGLGVSLNMIQAETLPKLFQRHHRLATATREGVKAMGLELFAKVPSDSITAVKSPEGISGADVVKRMQQTYGVTIIGGQDELKKKIFRLGHMGFCGEFDILAMIGALEMTLKDLGFKIELGRGTGAALKSIHESLTKHQMKELRA